MLKQESLHLVAAVTLALLAICIHTTAAVDSKQTPEEIAMKFLRTYGYFDEPESDTQVGMAAITQISAEVLKQKLMDMQEMAGIKQTGELDAATLKMMSTPRCGVSDRRGLRGSGKRRRRYALGGSKWERNSLTYGFSDAKYTKQLSQDLQRKLIAQAFGFWSSVTPLTFSESNSNPDIDIEFAKGLHGKDGKCEFGGNIAHSDYPRIGAAAHFNEEFSYVIGVKDGTDLLETATHEFGHSLGLAHSNDTSSIMYPYFQDYQPNFALSSDDIAGIQSIYGPRKQNGATTKPDVPATAPEICSNPTINAIVYIDGVTYAFKDDDYYVLTNNGIESGYPKKISSNWPGLNGKIDAIINYPAVTRVDRRGRTVVVKEGSVFFFQGSKYTKYTKVNQMVPGYPKPISKGFPGLPDDLDTCFTWSGNGIIYCIKGDQYYSYTPGVGVDEGFPQPLSVWSGLPSQISAAFQWKNRVTYFFSKTSYYEFDDYNITVASANPPYPRDTGKWWFGCSSSGKPGNILAERPDERNQLKEIEIRYNSSTKSISFLSLYMLLISCWVFLFGKYL